MIRGIDPRALGRISSQKGFLLVLKNAWCTDDNKKMRFSCFFLFSTCFILVLFLFSVPLKPHQEMVCEINSLETFPRFTGLISSIHWRHFLNSLELFPQFTGLVSSRCNFYLDLIWVFCTILTLKFCSIAHASDCYFSFYFSYN